jgi:CheY-like chemotaxis protein
VNQRGLPVILIAEDDLGDRVLLEQAFRATSFEADVRFTANGEEFLAYLRREPPWENAERPDLILLDLNMPRMDGREVLREVKGNSAWKSIPVVVLINSRRPEDVEIAYECGANTYIVSRIRWTSLRGSFGWCASFGSRSRCCRGRFARR